MICTGCSCLCDDVEVDEKILNACRIGADLIMNFKISRSKPMVNGKVVDLDSAIESAIEILKDSNEVVIYGLNRSTLEAQREAAKIAKKISAYMYNGSDFPAEKIFEGELTITRLEDVRDNAYVVIYWKCDVHCSMPRHLSRYTYYPHGKNRQGYEDRFLVVVDVRRNRTSKVAKAFFLKHNRRIIEDFMRAFEGKAVSGEILKVVNEIKKSDFNVVFGYDVEDDFFELAKRVGYFIPTNPHPNTMGFFKVVFENEVRRDVGNADTFLLIGEDLNSMKFDLIKRISKSNLIVIDPKVSFISKFADVVIPSAISGVECGGTMIRSDLVEVNLKPIYKNEIYDKKILRKISEGL